MSDIIDRLRSAIVQESAAHSPRTTLAIEAMREAIVEIARLRDEVEVMHRMDRERRALS